MKKGKIRGKGLTKGGRGACTCRYYLPISEKRGCPEEEEPERSVGLQKGGKNALHIQTRINMGGA